RGHLVCLKYAHEAGCPMDELTCIYAAMYGHIACLEYAHRHGCDVVDEALMCAVNGGDGVRFERDRADEGRRLECLRYLHTNGGILRADLLRRAVEAGQTLIREY